MEENIININNTIKLILKEDSDDSSTIIISLDGYLDTYNSTQFQTEVKDIIEKGYNFIIFECEKLKYISSMGVGVFAAFKRILGNTGEIYLMNVSPDIKNVLKQLGFLNFFKIIKDIKDTK